MPLIRFVISNLIEEEEYRKKAVFMKLFTQIVICFFSVLVGSACLAADVDTIVIQSKVMHKQFKAAVILPDAYQNSSAQYPSFIYFMVARVAIAIGSQKQPTSC